MTIDDIVARYTPRLITKLKQYLPTSHELYGDLLNAIQHAVFNGGKRIRPILSYATGRMLGATFDALDAPACAVEYMHCSSLVHDDLPAMDNSNLRRGNPTCHLVYGDDMAILAGDALMILAHEVISNSDQGNLSHRQRLQMLSCLSKSSGAAGMVAGQAIDIRNLAKLHDVKKLQFLHELKTGALIKASILMGAYASPTTQAHDLDVLNDFADMLGLAFQVQDDILDESGSTDTLGKPQGIDASNQKSTFTSLLGLEGAKAYAAELVDNALSTLAKLNADTNELAVIAKYVLNRHH